MNLLFSVADIDQDDSPRLTTGRKIENNTGWAAAVANYARTPAGVWMPWPLSPDGLSVVTSPQARQFPWTYTAPMATGVTVNSESTDALYFLRAQLGVVTDQPAIVTLVQDTIDDFTDLTRCLVTQAETEEQADGSFRILLVVDLSWRWVMGMIENDSGNSQTFINAQLSLSGVR